MTPTDPAIQAAEDSATIVNYLADLGLSDVNSVLESGVHYAVLDSGQSNTIDESDIVTFHYTGKLLSDTIFDTTIKEIADSIRVLVQEDTIGVDPTLIQSSLLLSFSEDRSYSPIQYTYSASGWTLSTSGFIDGFNDGVSASLNGLRVGGKSLIVIPSAEAYGTRGSGALIGPNTVIAFELDVVEVVKQGE